MITLRILDRPEGGLDCAISEDTQGIRVENPEKLTRDFGILLLTGTVVVVKYSEFAVIDGVSCHGGRWTAEGAVYHSVNSLLQRYRDELQGIVAIK